MHQVGQFNRNESNIGGGKKIAEFSIKMTLV